MEKTMKRIDVVQLKRDLMGLSHLRGSKFTFFLDKNIKKLNKEIKKIDIAIKEMAPAETEALKKCKEIEEKIVMECAKVDQNGMPMIDKVGKYEILPDKEEEFDKRMDNLKEEYPTEMKLVEDFHEKYENYIMKEDINLELHYIKQDELPQDINYQEKVLLGDLVVE